MDFENVKVHLKFYITVHLTRCMYRNVEFWLDRPLNQKFAHTIKICDDENADSIKNNSTY